MQRTVSVVIPVYNAAKTLSDVLKAVMSQDCQEVLEVIVVDDGSKDETADIVKSFDGVRYFYQESSGPAAARNRGAYESKGDIIFFTDSDCIPEKGWISRSIVRFDDESVGAVSGSYGIANSRNVLSRCVHREIIFRHSRIKSTFIRVFGSYNFAIRRSVFEETGGFNESYRHPSGEDNDLSYRIIKKGYRIYFENDSIVRHYHPVSLYGYLKHQFWHGFWRAKLYKDHPGMLKGDDYTFWKDAVEWPIALFIILVACGVAVANNLFQSLSRIFMFFLYFASGALLIVQLYYSLKMMDKFWEALFYSLVMFLRAFWRGCGFVAGFFYFFPGYWLKNISSHKI